MICYGISASVLPLEGVPVPLVREGQNTLLVCHSVDNYALLQYLSFSPLRYIRQCIAKADTPHLMLMSKERVYSSLPHNDFHMPGISRNAIELLMPSPFILTFQLFLKWPFSSSFYRFPLSSLYEESGHQSKLFFQLHRSALEDKPHFQVKIHTFRWKSTLSVENPSPKLATCI